VPRAVRVQRERGIGGLGRRVDVGLWRVQRLARACSPRAWHVFWRVWARAFRPVAWSSVAGACTVDVLEGYRCSGTKRGAKMVARERVNEGGRHGYGMDELVIMASL
jgi:hypothetical protein